MRQSARVKQTERVRQGEAGRMDRVREIGRGCGERHALWLCTEIMSQLQIEAVTNIFNSKKHKAKKPQKAFKIRLDVVSSSRIY